MTYLGLGDIVLITSKVLRIGPEALLRSSQINLADAAVHVPAASLDGVEFHPGRVQEIGVLGYRVIRNHPFPEGNKRVAFLAMIEMAERNGARWTEPADDRDGR